MCKCSTNIINVTCIAVKAAGSFSLIFPIPLAFCVTCVYNRSADHLTVKVNLYK